MIQICASIRLSYTSETVMGQVYVPLANYIRELCRLSYLHSMLTVQHEVLILCIIVVAAFKSATALSLAYGFAVATVMFSTTVLLAIQMYYVKHIAVVFAVAYFIVFGFFDGTTGDDT